jgi:hypothetical protein
MSDKEETSITAPGIDLENERIYFDYIKSNYFRTVYIDGVFGGLSPKADVINMSVFSERWPLPKQVVHKLKNGKCQEEIIEERVTRNAIVREVDVTLVFNIEQAKSLREWLDNKIKLYNKREKQKKT